MKKNFLALFLCFLGCAFKAQVIFCPAGAEWSYNFGRPGPNLPATLERITYVRDSVINSETSKVLRHAKFYMECNGLTDITLIKQKGDTVFMRNSQTNNSWQILYNFNVTAGQSWETTLTVCTYTVKVDSINFVIENGFNLKRLFVTYKRIEQSGNKIYQAILTERFGCNAFLFNYYNNVYQGCDFDWFLRFLCYKDNQFGIKQFTSYACDYERSMYTGLQSDENTDKIIMTHPNPVVDILSLEFQNKTESENYSFQVFDLTGRQLLNFNQSTVIDSKIRLDLSSLQKGAYFLQVIKDRKLSFTKKIIKE